MQALRNLFVCFLFFSFLRISTTTTLDTITPSRYIRDGETLVSAGGSFELGFFSPGASQGRYLGIWYTFDTEAVVWVANREIPLGNSSGVLKVTEQGVLVLLNSSNRIAWSSNSSTTAGNPVSQLLDSGNLVVKDGNETNPDKFLWQSFDYPCDTFLPEMKLGWDLVTGLDRYVSSWRSTEDPAPGEFSLRMDRRGFPQVDTMKGAKIMATAGSWNGIYFTAYPYPPQTQENQILGHEFVLDKDEIYYEYRLLNRSTFSRYVLNPSGIAQRFTWVHQTHSWELSSTFQADQCQNYALCGAYTSCNMNVSPSCECLKGFVPKSPQDWNSGYWSDGCVRKIPLACSYGDGFLKYTGVKLPDTSSSWFDESMSLKECKGLCLKNCSCTAYANLDVREGGTGCLLWFGNLTDIRQFTPGGGQDLYIRMAASELDGIEKKSKFNKEKLPGILISSAVFLVGTLIIGLILYIQKKKLRNQGVRSIDCRKDYLGEDRENMELPLFDLSTIAKATNDFSSSNKLGEGGFGPVYKGTLIGGEEIAVKRLSKDSGQGLQEFKNEVILIAGLQHRNLVKLLGCCIKEDEKILIYEFMPNGSLDFFIFDDIEKRSKFKKKRQAGIVISSILFLVVMLIAGFILYIRKKKLRNQVVRKKDDLGEDREDRELPLFDFNTIVHATNGFSSRNKLGEGGFGPVYQGTLIGGKEIAVKRLSKDSGQGMREFKNEVILIAKLQHRNLVKLLGCCTQDDEKILIYEFMANRSLDFYIFDQGRAKLLDWPKCFHIIDGIARGLLYLHQDSRLRIIHRDLKASNILLDNDMNPKISDFGLARIFGADQSRGNTKRVVGTYGYMPPEYAVDGIFSTKSDVFSFGVILLEILSRQKNRGFWHPDHHLNLLGHAWTLWIQNIPLELIDKSLSDSCTISEVLRCLHVALLCVQQVPEDRPSMSSVVLMLSSEVALPPPKQPGFYTERTLPDDPSRVRDLSENNFSTTLLEAR